MKNITVRSLREDEKRQFFKFAKNLPSRDFWGKKGYYLRGDFGRFQEFFEYIQPFKPRCFLVAEEDNEIVGYTVAVYNPTWMDELKERYRYEAAKRAYILGIGVVQRRKDVLKALTLGMADYFSHTEIESAEYPTLGSVCLSTGTDILTPENVDPLLIFREAGFRISECYYSMELQLDKCKNIKEHQVKEGTFRFKKSSIEFCEGDEVLGRIMWDPIENGKTSIGIYVTSVHRGKGLGTALMAKALQRLKTESVKVVELGVDGSNLPALKLYRKFGFEVDTTHFYIFVPFTARLRAR